MKLSRGDWLIMACLFASTVAIYARTAKFDFVNYDDNLYVFENEFVPAGLTWANVRWAFTTLYLANWHPLTWLSYMTDVQLLGLRAGAFHLVNVAVHAVNTVLLFWLLGTITGSRWRSALVAALFALHPLHVESVAWISERKDVLSTLFGFMAMIAYWKFVQRRSALAYLATNILFALSLLAKPMLVTLPFVLLLLDYWPLRRTDIERWPRLILEKLPLVGLSAASSVVAVIAQRAGGAMSTLQGVPLDHRIENALITYVRYMMDMFWPARLAVLYPLKGGQALPLILGAIAVLVAITALAFFLAPHRRHLAVGWLWYLGTLVPTIGIITVGEQSRADRYTYVPLIGLFVMIAWRIPAPRSRRATIALAGATALLLMVMSFQTWRQLSFWRNGETLMGRALAISGPQPNLLVNYGVMLAMRGDYRGAAECYEQAIKLRPQHPIVLNNLGDCLAREGRTDEAIVLFRRAIQMEPTLAMAHLNLGMRLAQQGRVSEAEPALAEAVRLRPDLQDAAHLILSKARGSAK